MVVGVETRLDDATLVVRIPLRFQRRGGRKRIVAPDGSEVVPSSKPQADGTLVKALARAWRWQRMLEQGGHVSIRALAGAEGVSHAYVLRILRFTLLAPDIVESVLIGGQATILDDLARLLRPFAIGWVEQRERLR